MDRIEDLSRDGALRLLAGSSVGRVGITMGALPAILPVNYAMLEDAIVFRTAPGTKFTAALKEAVVAFEVDAADHNARTGWSVLVVGRARQICEPDRLERARALDLDPWSGWSTDQFVEIPLDIVSGRRIRSSIVNGPNGHQ